MFINSSNEEIKAKQLIEKYFDSSYKKLAHNKKRDDFDFTDPERTFAVEQTTYIESNTIEVKEYEEILSKGFAPNKHKLKGVTFSDDNHVSGYIGKGPSTVKREIIKVIRRKNRICQKRIEKEKTFKKVDLIITIPFEIFYMFYDSIASLDECVCKNGSSFSNIYLVFASRIYLFNVAKRLCSFIDYPKWVTFASKKLLLDK